MARARPPQPKVDRGREAEDRGRETEDRGREAEEWELRLYIAGQTARSLAALANLRRVCDRHLEGLYRIEVIDLLKNPTLARGDQILAVPTLVRKLPEPMKRIIGDLSNEERLLVGLNLPSRGYER